MVFFFLALCMCLIYLGNSLHFYQHPLNTTVKSKSSGSLGCFVEFDTGDVRQYDMKWRKDGEYISSNEIIREDLFDANHFLISKPKSRRNIIYTITFHSVWNSDRGFYQCVVFENNKLQLESNKAFLDVIQIPDDKYPLCSVSQTIYTEGDDVMLVCESEYTKPEVTLQWSEGKDFVVEKIAEKTARLQKKLTARPHLNGYQAVCQMTNSEISELKRNCTTQPLTIYYKPIPNIPQSGLISVGRQAIFICKSKANPAVALYTWKTIPAVDAEEYNIDNTGVFMLLNPTIQHDGVTLICTAENDIGMSSSNVSLIVKSDSDKHVTIKSVNTSLSHINTINNDEIKNENEISRKGTSNGLSTDMTVIIIVACIVFLVIIVMIPVYYYCLCSRNSIRNETTTIVHQPEVYFEPRDRMTLPLPRTRDAAIWRRSFAAQAPDDKEVDAMYLEIQSNHYIYATSRCNTIK